MEECLARVNYWRDLLMVTNRHYPHVQPYLDFNNPDYVPPRWQKDMARWCGIKAILKKMTFAEYEPRKGFTCQMYLDHPELRKCKTKEEIAETLYPHTDSKNHSQYVIDFFE